jgi:hypothetical protein
MVPSGLGGDAGAGVMVEVLDPGMQAQKFLCAFSPFEALLLPFLTRVARWDCSTMLLQRAVEITCWWSTLTRFGISRIAAP